jgi:hypothetical protein
MGQRFAILNLSSVLGVGFTIENSRWKNAQFVTFIANVSQWGAVKGSTPF